LLKEGEDIVAIQAIIAGTNRGRIFVDDPRAPRTALVWAIFSMYYLVGDDQNPAFNLDFSRFLSQQLAPANLNIGATWFIVTLLSDLKWPDPPGTLFQGRSAECFHRWTFTFQPELYRRLPDWRDQITSGYELRRIGPDLLDSCANREAVLEAIETWPSPHAFFEGGIGYCILVDGKVASWCVSAYMHANSHEISIATPITQQRRKGLATLAARAYIDECLQRGCLPEWDTETTNLGSNALAEKLGFVKHQKQRCFEFPF